jgi:hypothetical protein
VHELGVDLRCVASFVTRTFSVPCSR